LAEFVKMVIVIEGANGTGKTVLAKRLAKKLGYEYVHFPTKRGDSFPGLVTWFGELFRATGDQKYARWDMDVNERAISKCDKVVVDRMRLSNYVYSILNFLDPQMCPLFSETEQTYKEITLVMSPALLSERLSRRDIHCEFETKEKIIAFSEKANKLFETYGSQIVYVDGLNEDQILAKVMSIL
jgi:thymidylate kinase